MPRPEDLLELAHKLASPLNDMAILAEGNVSSRADGESFWVKGSGQAMGTMAADGFSRVRLEPVLAAFDREFDGDHAIREVLNDARIEGPNPSTETFMHAELLSMDGVGFVGHTHPVALLSLLCLSEARWWADKRLFPDEIVCCGPAACFIPYVAPGLELARSIRQETKTFRERFGVDPKTYWLENHGLIAVGRNAKEVESASLMSVKAARVLIGALQSGREVKAMTREEVAHIYHWPDEHARQRALWGAS